jgi:cobalt-precorrin-5B (C1)-methyltransferase
MILIFGGTTEGKIAAEILDNLDERYVYCTKEPVNRQFNGEMQHGALDAGAIEALCTEKDVRIIIDAAHPFASELHRNVFEASQNTGIPIVRVERKFDFETGDAEVRIFDSFEHLDNEIAAIAQVKTILALTGVQTINKLTNARKSHHVYFRILDSESSMQKAVDSGIDMKYIIPAPAHITLWNLKEMSAVVKPDIILTKESGNSGYFAEKIELAQYLKKPLWVVGRPSLYYTPHTATSPKELMQCILKLRKELMKDSKNLRSGYTTGSCVTAAAAASFSAIMSGYFDTEQTITMPDGSELSVLVFDGTTDGCEASCIVIKDAGDDPDVTHAAEIGCRVRLIDKPEIVITRGKGIGLVTLPGLRVEPGQAAINPTPQKMIRYTMKNLFVEYDYSFGVEITPFIPEGEKLALRTFNPRIGIEGGISVLGTTGYVRPYSSEAFMNAIVQQINVAYRQNSDTIAVTAGKRSEEVLQPLYPELGSLSFVHYGNSVGETIKLCSTKGFRRIVAAMMLGKAIKLAEGHLDTHSKLNTFNAQFATSLAQELNYPATISDQIGQLTLANAITAIIPFSDNEPFYLEIINRCLTNLVSILDNDTKLDLYLINPADNQFIRQRDME